MIGAPRILTMADRDRIAAQVIAERRAQRPLAETRAGRLALAQLAAGPCSADSLATVLGMYPHEAETLLRELAARGLAKQTPDGWIA